MFSKLLSSLAAGIVSLNCSRLLLEPGLEAVELSATIVVNGGALSTLRVELDGRVSLDIDSIDLVGGGVHLGNGEASNFLEISS